MAFNIANIFADNSDLSIRIGDYESLSSYTKKNNLSEEEQKKMQSGDICFALYPSQTGTSKTDRDLNHSPESQIIREGVIALKTDTSLAAPYIFITAPPGKSKTPLAGDGNNESPKYQSEIDLTQLNFYYEKLNASNKIIDIPIGKIFLDEVDNNYNQLVLELGTKGKEADGGKIILHTPGQDYGSTSILPSKDMTVDQDTWKNDTVFYLPYAQGNTYAIWGDQIRSGTATSRQTGNSDHPIYINELGKVTPVETVLTHYGGSGLYYYLTPDPNNQEQQKVNTNIVNNRLYYYSLKDNGIEINPSLKASNHVITDNTIGLNMKDEDDNLKELLKKENNIISGLQLFNNSEINFENGWAITKDTINSNKGTIYIWEEVYDDNEYPWENYVQLGNGNIYYFSSNGAYTEDYFTMYLTPWRDTVGVDGNRGTSIDMHGGADLIPSSVTLSTNRLEEVFFDYVDITCPALITTAPHTQAKLNWARTPYSRQKPEGGVETVEGGEVLLTLETNEVDLNAFSKLSIETPYVFINTSEIFELSSPALTLISDIKKYLIQEEGEEVEKFVNTLLIDTPAFTFDGTDESSEFTYYSPKFKWIHKSNPSYNDTIINILPDSMSMELTNGVTQFDVNSCFGTAAITNTEEEKKFILIDFLGAISTTLTPTLFEWKNTELPITIAIEKIQKDKKTWVDANIDVPLLHSFKYHDAMVTIESHSDSEADKKQIMDIDILVPVDINIAGITNNTGEGQINYSFKFNAEQVYQTSSSIDISTTLLNLKDIATFNLTAEELALTGTQFTINALTTFQQNVTLDPTVSISRVKQPETSVDWAKGRDTAMLKLEVNESGYFGFISMKTATGSWDIGHCDDEEYQNNLVFTHANDTQYQLTPTISDAQIRFTDTGAIMTKYFVTANYGPDAPNSLTAGTGTLGALYFKLL